MPIKRVTIRQLDHREKRNVLNKKSQRGNVSFI